MFGFVIVSFFFYLLLFFLMANLLPYVSCSTRNSTGRDRRRRKSHRVGFCASLHSCMPPLIALRKTTQGQKPGRGIAACVCVCVYEHIGVFLVSFHSFFFFVCSCVHMFWGALLFSNGIVPACVYVCLPHMHRHLINSNLPLYFNLCSMCRHTYWHIHWTGKVSMPCPRIPPTTQT